MRIQGLRVLPALLATAGVGALMAASDGPAALATAPASSVARSVRVEAVRELPEVRSLRFAGLTRARDRATLSFTIGGRVAARPVDIGDAVEAGQIVAVLDEQPLRNEAASARAALAEATARAEQARRDHKRIRDLFAQNAVSAQDFERARAAESQLAATVDAAEARRAEAERRLREATLRAPFAGIVTRVGLEPDEFAAPGAAVVTLAGAGIVEVEIEVPGRIVAGLREQDHARVHLPMSGNDAINATIVSVARSGDGVGGLFPVLLELDDAPGLAAGLAAEVELELGGKPVAAVPVTAITDPTGRRPSVFAARDGRAARVPVEVGSLQGEWITVRGPLGRGDQVIVAGHGALADGDEVAVAH